MKLLRTSRHAAITLIELLVVLAVLTILFAFLVPLGMRGHKASPSRIECVNNLKQIGVGFLTWAGDHDGKFPMEVPMANRGMLEFIRSQSSFMNFQVLSNELATTKVLICPADKNRTAAMNFTSDLNNSKVSYFIGIDATQTNFAMFLAGDRNITNGSSVQNGILTLTTNQTLGWTEKLHNRAGNLLFADGHVEQLTTPKLREALQNTGVATNRLAIP